MFAARQRVGYAARQLQRATRSYASDSHSHHKPAEVNESFGTGSLVAVGAFFGGVLVYQFAPKDGQSSGITGLIEGWSSKAEDWEAINTAHAQAAKQAGFDRNLFENATPTNRWVDVNYPEALQSHCPRNIRAGHILSIDSVVEHYKQEHLKDEGRKAEKLAREGN